MAFDDPNAGMPFGYTGLTPDQIAMVNQQGWYPQSAMSLPTGQSVQQPQGYNNLTPAQAQQVAALGYYQQQQQQGEGQGSLWDKLKAGLGSPDLTKGLQQLGATTGQGQPRGPMMPPSLPFSGGVSYPVSYLRQMLRSASPLDPRQALAQLLRGY